VTERKRTKAEERAYARLHDTLQELRGVELDMRIHFERLIFDHMPSDWAAVEGEHPVRMRKVRITAGYDEDVARFFRTMGQGYQARMNAVLRAYMLAVQSREIPSKKNEDWMGNQI
jgi:uncharacterized protein (DUF4415 family)